MKTLQQRLSISAAIWLSSVSYVLAQKTVEDNDTSNAIGTTLYLTDEMRAFFSEGFDVRVLLRSRGSAAGAEQEPTVIGNATLIMQGEQLLVRNLDIYGNQQNTVLNHDLIEQIKGTTNKAFDNQGDLTISNTARLQLDVLKMELFLDVTAEGFGVAQAKIQAQHLSPSSARQLSGLMKANSNIYHNRSNGKDNTSYNVGLDSVSSFAEHHMLFAANTYGNSGSNSSNSKTKIERWLYERDYNGKTVVAGLMNSWNLQTLAQVSTVNADRIYGASVGNRGSSVVAQKDALVVPIIVYFPSAGEAHIFRDEQLISIQRFAMGNHALEGGSLPSGIYDVRVDVVVAGQTVSSKAFQVNKPADGLRFGRSIGWQIWGGQMKEINIRQRNRDQQYDSYKTKDKGALYGLSLAGSLYSLDITASVYRNDTVTVQESALSLPVMQRLRLRLQSLYATDGTRRTISSLTWQVPGNLLYIWGNYETGSKGDTLSYWSRKNYTLGGSLYLGSFIPRAGSLSFSYDKSLQDDRTRTLRTDYNQNLYSGRWGTLSMNAGFNSTKSSGSGGYRGSSNNEKFVSLTFSMPLRANFNVGYSQDDYTRDFNVGADMTLDGAITSIGGTVTRNMPKSGTGGDSRTSYNGYANYDTRYGLGSLSLQGSRDNKSASLQNQSTLAWNSKGVALGKGGNNSGVIVQLPGDVDANQMEARVGQATYPLKGGSNLITVSPYNTYTVSIYDTGETDDSYNIDSQVNEYTLYPGNVVKLSPEVQKMITVFGRLTTPSGEALKHAKVSNHIGYTNTDEEGNFSIDVSRTTPQLMVESSDSGMFDINFNLKPRHKGAIWIGNLVLNSKTINYDLPEAGGDGAAPRF